MRRTQPLGTYRVTFSRVALCVKIRAASAKEARVIAKDFEARGELDMAGPMCLQLPEGRELEKEPCPENVAAFITDIEEVVQ